MKPGARIGRFEVTRRLGAGAMGTVYEARDPELGRSVAIKLVGDPEPHLELRLQREAQALAQLQHPNVVAVYELGVHAGQMFVAMELVDGVNLAGYLVLDDRGWRDIVRLFIDAGRGLAAVHAKGIVHRDIKPSNLLVDGDGRVRVGDFGLARLVGDDGKALPTDPPDVEEVATAKTVDGWHGETITSANGTPADGALATPLTRAGAIIGTPFYMAPEQLRGSRATPAADQFSFCVAMWIALFGTHPFGDIEGAASDRPTKVLVDVAPAVLAGKRRPTVRRRVPRWLVRVLDRGLASEPDKRFASMVELVAALEAGMATRRPIAIAAAASAVVLAGVIAWSVVSAQTRARRDDADARAQADVATLRRATIALDLDPADALALVSKLSPESASWRAARTVIADAIERGASRTIETHGHADLVALSADGALVAAVVEVIQSSEVTAISRVLHVWDATTLVDRWAVPVARDVTAIGFAPDAVIVTTYDGVITGHDLATGTPRQRRALAGEFVHAAIAPGGRYVLMASSTSPTFLVDLDGSERTIGTYHNAAWSPDGRIAVLQDRHDPRLDRLDVTTGEVTKWVPPDALPGVNVIGLATDGKNVWAGGWQGRVIELGTGYPYPRKTDHAGPMVSLVPMLGGRLVAASSTWRFEGGGDDDTGHADDVVTIGDDSSNEIAHLRGHRAEIAAIAVAGEVIASTDRGGAIRLWRRPPLVRHVTPRTTAGAATGDGHDIIVARRGPILEVTDADTHVMRSIYITDGPPGYEPPPAGVLAGRRITIGDITMMELYVRGDAAVTAIARAGRIVATLDSLHQVVVWNLDTNRGHMLVDHVARMALAADGSHLVTARDDKAITRWDLTTLAETTVGHGTPSLLACSHDCSIVAVASAGRVELTGRGTVLASSDDNLAAIAFSPDDTTLVAGGDARELRVWSVATGELRSFPGATATITRVAYLPDGRVAAASHDGTIQLWRLADGSETTLRGHTAEIRSIELAGDTLVTASADHTARIWDLVAGTSRALAGPDQFAARTADGHIATADSFDTVAWFADDLPVDEAGLRDGLARWTSAPR